MGVIEFIAAVVIGNVALVGVTLLLFLPAVVNV